MGRTCGVNETLEQSIKTEHYRLHCMERWPDSPYKDAVLTAVRSTLELLEGSAAEPLEPPVCMVCATRKAQPRLLMFPSRQKGAFTILLPAA